ncbi:MAG: TerC/Alx family metal homeostasis membrane protein [Desulfovibrio sp.]|jgi:tellurite resistance protein TerC|nr:TerC/Alx family metal homeostasis membrane protein [Desulfovibrio sp.]
MLSHYTLTHLVLFIAGVIVCLLVDLRAHKQDEPVSFGSALRWSVFWIGLAQCFALYVFITHGKDDASLFLAGYWLEKSLSVDNLFVMMAIFSSFAVREEYLHRVLFYGIAGALVLRMVFIAVGSSFLAIFGPYALGAFGLFVLWTAYKMWQQMRAPEKEIEDYSKHWSVTLAGKFFPIHDRLSGHDFFVRTEAGGPLKATPLFLCLVVIEFADIMFAFDSVPAVIAITQDPFLVYTSNIFAILGLRALYFLLAAARRYLVHLEKAVIVILVYIGLKMLLDITGLVHLPPLVSLAVVLGLLFAGIAASIFLPGKK